MSPQTSVRDGERYSLCGSQRANPGSAFRPCSSSPHRRQNVHIRVISPAIWFSGCKQSRELNCAMNFLRVFYSLWCVRRLSSFNTPNSPVLLLCVSRPKTLSTFSSPSPSFVGELYTIKFETRLHVAASQWKSIVQWNNDREMGHFKERHAKK